MELSRLPERPKAEVLRVESILDLARRGRLRVPHFQTGFRWRSREVVALFDSIVRGFPIGSLLLWRRGAEPELLRFGPVHIDAGPEPEALFVVDGQQRVTALVGAMLHPDLEPLGGLHAVWCDLRTGTFEVLRARVDGSSVPVSVLADRVRLLQWTRRLPTTADSEALISRAFEMHNTLLSFEIPAYVVTAAAPDTLKLIFSRINNTGVRLTEAQVFDALFGGDADRHPLDDLAIALDEETGFGRLSTGWLLRCVKAVGEVDPRASFDEQRAPTPELLARAHTAMRRAVKFLIHTCGFVHSSVLPYRFPLIVLARFFDQFPAPDARNDVLLDRWVWRGALSGAHAGSSHAAVSAHLTDIGGDESASVQRLLRRVPRTVTEVPDPRRGWFGQAAASRLYAALQLAEASTLADVGSVQLRLRSRDLGEVFRPIHPDIAPFIAGRVPSLFGPEEIYEDAATRPALVGPFGALLDAADWPAVLEQRAQWLESRLRTHVLKHGGADESDRPPIRAILAAVG